MEKKIIDALNAPNLRRVSCARALFHSAILATCDRIRLSHLTLP